ncbi:MAG: YSC84-related protein [Bryobacteraceae bacterium]
MSTGFSVPPVCFQRVDSRWEQEHPPAAGAVGRSTSVQTDALLHGDVLSWSRTRSMFAGIALQGATLRQDLDHNQPRDTMVCHGNASWFTRSTMSRTRASTAGSDFAIPEITVSL